jgi:cell volume regulation protein A
VATKREALGADDAETAVTTSELGLVLLVGAAVVLAAIVAARVAHGIGLPGLLLFLGLGLALGEAGVGVRFDNAGLAEALGLSALVLILAEGGLTTNWAHVRAAAPAALSLATVGVVVSVLVVVAAARWLLGLGWREALLLGAVLAPTDAAAVFSVLRKLPLPPRLAGMLEGESGLNDPPAVLAVTLLSDIGHHPPSGALIAGEITWQLAAGAAIGGLAGMAGALALRRVALPASGLYPIAILALIVASYGAATLARASGFLAVYVSALVLGNARLPHGPAVRGFAEGVAWLAQIGLFVMLGLLASPARLPAQIIPAVVAGSVLVLAARPAAVAAATLPLRVPWRQQGFLSWAGLRGAVPIVLATIPMNARVPGATRLFDIVFIIVVINTAVQGPTLPWAARRLKVIAPAEPLDVDVEAAPLEALHADLLQVQIPAGSRLHGVEIFELRLPAQASIALIVRDGKGFVPSPTTPLRTADRLLIVASAAVREQTERRLRAVSRAGKLAGWFGEHGRLPGRPVTPARRDGQVAIPGRVTGIAVPFRAAGRGLRPSAGRGQRGPAGDRGCDDRPGGRRQAGEADHVPGGSGHEDNPGRGSGQGPGGKRRVRPQRQGRACAARILSYVA